jgi:hypothetical protein
MSGQFEKGREENNKIRHSSSTENQLHFIETNRTTRSYQHIENRRTLYSTVQSAQSSLNGPRSQSKKVDIFHAENLRIMTEKQSLQYRT